MVSIYFFSLYYYWFTEVSYWFERKEIIMNIVIEVDMFLSMLSDFFDIIFFVLALYIRDRSSSALQLYFRFVTAGTVYLSTPVRFRYDTPGQQSIWEQRERFADFCISHEDWPLQDNSWLK